MFPARQLEYPSPRGGVQAAVLAIGALLLCVEDCIFDEGTTPQTLRCAGIPSKEDSQASAGW